MDIRIDVGQIGGRSGKYDPVNTVWSAMGSIARQSAVGTFSPYVPSTAPPPEHPAQRTTQTSAPSHPITAPAQPPNAKVENSRINNTMLSVAKHVKPFETDGITHKNGTARCIPCNHPIQANTLQNFFDRLATDSHDNYLGRSLYVTCCFPVSLRVPPFPLHLCKLIFLCKETIKP